MASSPLAAAKQQLRKQMKQRLSELAPPAVSDQSSAIFRALVSFPPFANARRVAIFLSMPTGEVQTDAIVRHALASGKQVFVPFLHKSSVSSVSAGSAVSGEAYAPPRVMDMVQLHDTADYEALQPDRWGIPSVSAASVASRRRVLGDNSAESLESLEKPDTAQLSPLDLILMPGVAFDVDPAHGRIRRCGHGRGFYDHFLHRYAAKAAGLPQLYGLALTEQVLPGTDVESVPTASHDHTLDGLITGTGRILGA